LEEGLEAKPDLYCKIKVESRDQAQDNAEGSEVSLFSRAAEAMVVGIWRQVAAT
jgi:hypothetical protein